MEPQIGLGWCGMFSCFLGLNLFCLLVLWPISWLLGRNQATGTSPGTGLGHEPIRNASSRLSLLGCCVLVLVLNGCILGSAVVSTEIRFQGAFLGAFIGLLFSIFLAPFLDPSPTPTEPTEEGELPSPGPRWSERQEDGSTQSQGIQPAQDDLTERPPETP
jgi:hypothetical protein